MRGNPMRAGVMRGELQIGTWINMIRNPAILPLLKAAGLDFARVDMEHSSPSMETIAVVPVDGTVCVREPGVYRLVVKPAPANSEARTLSVQVWQASRD